MDCDYPGKNAFQKKRKKKKNFSYMNGKDSDVFGKLFTFYFLFILNFHFFSKQHNGTSRDVTLPQILL